MTALERSSDFGECVERHYGIYPGVVEKVVDPEGKGRITVMFNWISNTFESEFAPVAQIYAGSGYGVYWKPEEKDQVIVAFLNGELRRPIVLGSIHCDARKPHAPRTDTSDAKILRTKAGHMLLMEDKQGKRIELVDASGKNSVIIDTEANSVTVKAEADIIIEAGGSLTLNAGSDITIAATGQVTITGATINLN